MDERLKSNLLMWNEVTAVHAAADFYNLEGFKRGDRELHQLELDEVGDVRGKSLLHLQCHFGMDTLSWARLGATVTGLDFSDKAIELARTLAAELKIPATFVQSNVYDARSAVSGEFDIVFSSYGAISWLPDLKEWAKIVAHFVKPGGFFYIADMHPFLGILNGHRGLQQLEVEYPYFHTDMIVDEPEGDYADGSFIGSHASHNWLHSVESIINSLIGAGLRIDFWRDHRECPWAALPFAKKGADRLWRIEGDPIPLIFSLKASKP